MAKDQSTTNDKTEGGIEDLFDSDAVIIDSKPAGGMIHVLSLKTDIQDSENYTEMFNVLADASKKDKVILKLASPGGLCHAGFEIVDAMRACAAGVNVIATGPCASMAAIIALAGKSLTMWPSAFLMFHNYSSKDYGKGKEKLDSALHYYSHFHKQLKRVCYPFLTQKELNQLKHDKDVYINPDDADYKARIKRHFK